MKNKKKILFVIASLKLGGGAEKVVTTIGTKLYEKGYDVYYLTFYDYPKEELYPFKGKYFTLNEKLTGNIFIKIIKLFTRAWKIKQYCKRNNIDVSISHMEEANFSNILSKKLFLNKSRIFISIHNFVNKKSGFYKFLVKKLYNFSKKIITIVYEEKENLIKNYGIKKEKIEVIYNPIDLEQIEKLKKEEVKEEIFNNGKFTFINIGRLTYQKNQELLIKVFKEFNKKYPKTQLIILGEGELRKNLEEQIGNNENIYFLGKKKNPYKYLYNSDCFVFTSRWEGFGIVLIEALACGLPVISSDCSTGPKEILRKENNNFESIKKLEIVDYGILYPEGNEEELFKAMEKIYLDKKLRKELEEKAIERSKDFEVEKIVGEWERLIEI